MQVRVCKVKVYNTCEVFHLVLLCHISLSLKKNKFKKCQFRKWDTFRMTTQNKTTQYFLFFVTLYKFKLFSFVMDFKIQVFWEVAFWRQENIWYFKGSQFLQIQGQVVHSSWAVWPWKWGLYPPPNIGDYLLFATE